MEMLLNNFGNVTNPILHVASKYCDFYFILTKTGIFSLLIVTLFCDGVKANVCILLKAKISSKCFIFERNKNEVKDLVVFFIFIHKLHYGIQIRYYLH